MTATVHRFFVPADEMRGDAFPIPPSIAHQVTRVLRLHDGDELVLLDGEGAQATCRKQDGDLVVVARDLATGEPRHRLNICQALLKGDGLDRVVQQGTELGVASFRLIVTERCVARELSERRLHRLRAIAREAAEQAERGRVPEVLAPVPFESVLEPGATLLYERANKHAARLSTLDPPSTLIIGPEGGLTPDEVLAAAANRVQLASLGPRILRSESVALAGAAIVLSRSGDFA